MTVDVRSKLPLVIYWYEINASVLRGSTLVSSEVCNFFINFLMHAPKARQKVELSHIEITSTVDMFSMCDILLYFIHECNVSSL